MRISNNQHDDHEQYIARQLTTMGVVPGIRRLKGLKRRELEDRKTSTTNSRANQSMAPQEVQDRELKTFEFITVNDPQEGRSSETRTKVKKHVMKDIGLSRRRPKKNPLVLDVVLDPLAQVGSSSTDPFATYPHELRENEQDLIHYIFRDNWDNPHRAYRREWFPLGQMDVASFNIVMSNAASFRDLQLGIPRGQRSLEAERFHLLALQSLNQRLADPNLEITDGLLGAVGGFIVHNEIIGDFEQWAVHHAGLVRLLDMRGGVDNIMFRQLRESMSWVELRGCYPQDQRPYFNLPPVWIDRIETLSKSIEGVDVPRTFEKQWNQLAPSSKETYASYAHLVRFSAHASQQSTDTDAQMWVKDERAGSWTTTLIHTLTSRYGDEKSSRHHTPAREVIRLSSMLYLASIWRRYGCGPICTDHLVTKLLKILNEYDIKWDRGWQVHAWVLLMGVIETGGQMRTEYLDKLRELAKAQHVSVQDVILRAKQVLWLKDAFPAIDTILVTETMDWTMKRL